MHGSRPLRVRTLRLAAVAAVVAGLACTEETVIFRDREPFNPPPDGAAGFLGYFDPGTKLTTCGNCHVGPQGQWENTAHAGALQTLVASGSGQDFCVPCHSVNDQGNSIAVAAGFNAVPDSTLYGDVQCESCHGPGLEHVSVDPGATQPIPGIDLGAGLDQNCAECHTGTHHPFAEEWATSGHAIIRDSPVGRADCQGCHRGQQALARFDADAVYTELDVVEHQPITCAVCHDPHNGQFAGQLRRPVDTNDLTEHLCAQCHNRRTVPDPGSSHGLEPHAPEADLLLGEAGWFPPNSSIEQGRIIASHGSEGNERLCATCHLAMFEVTDEETGDFVINVVGHSFRAIPCVDGNGTPLSPQPDTCGLTTDDRAFAGCTAAQGCHLTEGVASGLILVASTEIESFADELIAQLEQVDANLEDAGGEIDGTNPTFTVAEGAFFNYHLAIFGGSTLGAAAHNPFLVRAQLLASQQAVEDEYGVSPASPKDYEAEIQAVLARLRNHQ